MKTFAFAPPGPGAMITCVVLCILMLALAVMFIGIGMSGRNLRTELDSSGLRVRGDLYGRHIPYADLDLSRAEIVDLSQRRDLQLVLRTNGAALPGYATGWYRLRNKQKALAFLTSNTRALYVPTRKDYVLILGVQDPEALLRAISQEASGGKARG